MTNVITDTVKLLGFRAKDRVTGCSGVISTVCFDLYGCIQAALTGTVNDKGEIPDARWFDVSRLDVSSDRVMSPPATWTTDHGPAEKPSPRA